MNQAELTELILKKLAQIEPDNPFLVEDTDELVEALRPALAVAWAQGASEALACVQQSVDRFTVGGLDNPYIEVR